MVFKYHATARSTDGTTSLSSANTVVSSGTITSNVTFARAQDEKDSATFVEKFRQLSIPPEGPPIAVTPTEKPIELNAAAPSDLTPIVYAWLPLLKSGLSKGAFDSIGSMGIELVADADSAKTGAFVRSVLFFLSFWKLIRPKAPEPEFVLLPNGHLQAEWATGPGNFLVMEFRSDRRMLFGFYSEGNIVEGSFDDAKLQAAVPDLAKLSSSRQIWH